MKKLLLSCVLLLPAVSQAQVGTAALLDSMFTTQQATRGFNGNVVMEDHGTIVFRKSYGYRDVEQKAPNTDSSEFAMASVTKIFTATAILQLKEQKKLHLDDAFAKYFPDFPYPDITIRQLMAHTSGLPAYELFDSLAKATPDTIFSNKDVIPALQQWHKPLHNKPGEDWHYSSMNYCLLTLLVEKLSGLSLQEYFNKNIFEPAGMTHSYLKNYVTARHNPNRTENYDVNDQTMQFYNVTSVPREREMVYNMGGFAGQGGLVSTEADMLAFDKAYFNGQLIDKKTVEEAITPTQLNNGSPAIAGTLLGRGIAGYGLGWFVGVHPLLGKIVWHSGGRPGVSTMYVHDLSRHQAVLIMENVTTKASISAMALYTLGIANATPGIAGQ